MWNRKTWIIAALRRASYRYPYRYKAKAEARRERGKYECRSCHGLFGPKQVQIDHVEPVVPVDGGFTNWDPYVERIFCADPEGFQCLCRECHSKKTLEENTKRREHKKNLDKK